MRHLGAICVALALTFDLTSVSAVADEYTCIYVAKARQGLGQRIAGTRGTAEAHYRPNAPRNVIVSKRLKACNRAQMNCNAKLALRKLQGKNPNAKCVFVRSRRD